MSIHTEWGNSEHSLIVSTVESHWTTTDFLSTFEKVSTLLAETEQPINIVLDFTAARACPRSLPTAAIHVDHYSRPNLSRVLVVGAHPIIRKSIEVLRYRAPRAMKALQFVDSMEQALDIIHFDQVTPKMSAVSETEPTQLAM